MVKNEAGKNVEFKAAASKCAREAKRQGHIQAHRRACGLDIEHGKNRQPSVNLVGHDIGAGGGKKGLD